MSIHDEFARDIRLIIFWAPFRIEGNGVFKEVFLDGGRAASTKFIERLKGVALPVPGRFWGDLVRPTYPGDDWDAWRADIETTVIMARDEHGDLAPPPGYTPEWFKAIPEGLLARNLVANAPNVSRWYKEWAETSNGPGGLCEIYETEFVALTKALHQDVLITDLALRPPEELARRANG